MRKILTPSVRENAQQMQDSAKSATELNKEVLSSSGCVTHDGDSGSTVQVGDMLPFLSEKCEGICNEHGVGFQMNADPDLPEVAAETGHISEILTRLVTNAAEAARDVDNGAVALDIFPPGKASPGRNVDIFVRNRCSEMSQEALKKAFEPFHTTKTAEHFGLGLTTCAVVAGQAGMRLGIRFDEGTFTAWLAIPPAEAAAG